MWLLYIHKQHHIKLIVNSKYHITLTHIKLFTYTVSITNIVPDKHQQPRTEATWRQWQKESLCYDVHVLLQVYFAAHAVACPHMVGVCKHQLTQTTVHTTATMNKIKLCRSKYAVLSWHLHLWCQHCVSVTDVSILTPFISCKHVPDLVWSLHPDS